MTDSEIQDDLGGLPKPKAVAPLPATQSDIERALADARAASEALPQRTETDAQERAGQLLHVRALLPLSAAKAPRAELESRVHARMLKNVNAWRPGLGNLILAGRTRAGKTSAAVHLVRRLLHEGAIAGGEAFRLARSIRWQDCRALSAVGREARLGTGTPDAIVSCQRVRLLVLDDLGATDDRETLERVLDIRYQRELPTITTTGLRGRALEENEQSELAAALGDALTARLFECGASKGTLVEVF